MILANFLWNSFAVWSDPLQTSIGSSILGCPRHFPKIDFGLKSTFDEKINFDEKKQFWPNTSNFGKNTILAKKQFWTKNNFGQKTILDKKQFWPKKPILVKQSKVFVKISVKNAKFFQKSKFDAE